MEPALVFPYLLASDGTVVNSSDPWIIIGFVILAVLLYCSALISAAEVAFFSLPPEEIDKLKSNKGRRPQNVLRLYNMAERLLSTILVAGNLINIVIILLTASLGSRLFDFTGNPVVGFVIEAVVIIFILLFFGEIIPKVYASRNSTGTALFVANFLVFLEVIFRPLTSLLILSTTFVKKRSMTHHANISMDGLSDAFELTSDELKEDEKILKGIVNFGNINVSAIMCPRIDVTAADIESGFETIIPLIISSGFSRIPVYSDTVDNVKGILYAKDILPYMNNPGNFKWQTLLRPPYFVPETKKIDDLLKEFQKNKTHMAVVIDEYGGTSGIVTLEDVLEEIVGEITDESDQDEELYTKIDDNHYIFQGKILLNDFSRILLIENDPFEDVRGESETLAGLILELKGEIPQKNQVISYGRFNFRIESADRRRIKEIYVEIRRDEEKTEKE